MRYGKAGIPRHRPPPASARAPNARLHAPTASTTSVAAPSRRRVAVVDGRTVVSPVVTRQAVRSAAGTLIAGATPRPTAMASPAAHIASIATTNTSPARRCTRAPFAAYSAT